MMPGQGGLDHLQLDAELLGDQRVEIGVLADDLAAGLGRQDGAGAAGLDADHERAARLDVVERVGACGQHRQASEQGRQCEAGQ